jgi:hypothetical protein
MHRIEAWLALLEYSLDTKRKRHIAGGILMSVSVLFGGLAFTVMTLKTEEKNNTMLETEENDDEEQYY